LSIIIIIIIIIIYFDCTLYTIIVRVSTHAYEHASGYSDYVKNVYSLPFCIKLLINFIHREFNRNH